MQILVVERAWPLIGAPLLSESSPAWKYTVNLILYARDGRFTCAGTIWNTRGIITNAHCVDSITAKKVDWIEVAYYRGAAVKSRRLYSVAGGEVKSDRIPDYPGNNQPGHFVLDIGLLVFKDAIATGGYTQPPTVADGGLEARSAYDAGGNAFLIGLSLIGNPRVQYPVPRVLEFTVYSHESSAIHPGAEALFSRLAKPSCDGDSGGPVFIKTGRQIVLVALASSVRKIYGAPCGTESYMTVLAPHLDWLNATYRELVRKLN
jgi:V8-like Glu-specific endopeptidase